MEKVRERLLRATGALERAGVDYAVIGGNAAASWVASAEEAAVRNTPTGRYPPDPAERLQRLMDTPEG